MERLLQDVRFAVRLLWKNRLFAATFMLTVAVCIAANTAVFAIVQSVLLRPLPIPEADRVLILYNRYPRAGVDSATNSVPDYFDRLREVLAFEELALFRTAGQTVGADTGPQRLTSLVVTPSFMRVTRQTMYRGRPFADADGEPGQNRKVILTYNTWQQLFGGQDSAIGADLRVNGVPHVIVGVVPPMLRTVWSEVDIYLPVAFTPQDKSDDSRHSNNWGMLGRLRPGSTLHDAQNQVTALNARNLDRFPQFKQILINAGFETTVMGYQAFLVRESKRALYLLWGGVWFVLLIGCVNLTNLMLARSASRTRELATRHALGAGVSTLARQIVTETTLLTLVGGTLGLALGAATLRALRTMGLEQMPRGSEIHIDAAVVAATLAVSLALGIVIGLIPVLSIRGVELAHAFREEGRTGTGGPRARMIRRVLVTAQIACALVLLTGAALLLTSFRRVLAIDPGFATERVLTGNVNTPAARYPRDPDVRSFAGRLLERVRALPRVEAAGMTTTIPFGTNYSDSVILAEGYVMKPGESLISPSQIVVTDGYFETMRVPLRRGRFFDRRDTPDSPRVIIVDERLAQKFWPGQDPIGRRMYLPDDPADLLRVTERTQWLSVVGVVGEVKLQGLVSSDTRFGAYYFPASQSPRRNLTLAVRTTTDPEAMTASIRRELAAIDPELPFFSVQTMGARLDRSLTDRRTPMMLAMAFAAIALFLAGLGIYGVLAYQVRQRTREIGIRIALGGDARSVFALVLREGAIIIAAGIVIGVGGAFLLRQSLQTQLYQVNAMDPWVLAAVCAGLSVVAFIACALPARRAARIDPVAALAEQ